jgi:hypothetical protein
MRTGPAVLLVVLAGCTDHAADDPMQCWDVQKETLLLLRADLDLVVMVGNAASMAQEQAALADDAHLLVEQLVTLPGGLPDLHAAVMTDDDAMLLVPDGCPLTDGQAYLSDVVIDSGTGTREFNYTGELGDQLACMVEVGTSGDEVQRPLSSLARTIEEDSGGFRRPSVTLAVAIVTDGEDASPDEVGSYAQRILTRAPGSAAISVVSGGPEGCTLDGFTDAAPAPRLAAFADAFGTGGSATSLCGEAPLLEDVGTALRRADVGTCLADNVASGPTDCRVSDVWHQDEDDQREYPIPSCQEAAPPCFSIVEDALACPYTGSHRRLMVDRGGTSPREETHAVAACQVGEPECR